MTPTHRKGMRKVACPLFLVSSGIPVLDFDAI